MPTIESTPASPAPAAHLRLSDWIMAVLVAALLSLAIYRLAALIGQVRWGVRAGFLTLIGGLISYSYLALMLYQNPPQQSDSISLNVFLSTLGGGILGFFIALGWRFTSLMGRGKTALEETTSEALAHQGDRQTDE
jgi:phosphate/sulfate permease